jgi:GTP pyrophosphokinase
VVQLDTITEQPNADFAFQSLLETVTKFKPGADLAPLRDAYQLACEQHAHQKRASGEPYIGHPVAVTQMLAAIEMDMPTLCAGLLHDVVEDGTVTIEDISTRFGKEVASLVDGVTKLNIASVEPFTGLALKEEDEPQNDVQAERAKTRQEHVKRAGNLGKIFLAMAKDLRVMVIKLSDRLHNMRTLDSLSKSKRQRIADETLQIFAPLAHRLGIWQMKWELEDLAFKYAEPEQYTEIAQRVAQTRAERQAEVDEAIRVLQEKLQEEGFAKFKVNGRPKHLYSIYQKMQKQELNFDDIADLVAVRIIVNSRQECYHALGIVSALWTPVQGMYSDYIAKPKSNMYQSLHLKVIGPHGKPLEVQIRTFDMHRTAEFGVAAHWAYKEKGEGGKATDEFERKLTYLRQQLFDWQANAGDSSQFLRDVVDDLFTDQVFVFSPAGDVFDMPNGAGPIDFAYRIHSDVGNHTVGALVNGRMVKLDYQFQNGDVVEIIKRSNAQPSRDWLGLAKTSHARSKIKAYFRKLHHSDSVLQGRELLQREAERLGLDPHVLLRDEALRAVASLFNVPSEDELLASVGYGTVSAASVVNKLSPQALRPKGLVLGRGRADESKHKISAGSVDNVMFRRSRCCLPIPGDAVVGYVTRGRGMALHRVECPNALHYMETEPERMISVDFESNDGTQLYAVQLVVSTLDRTGLLADIGNLFGETKTFITQLKTQSYKDRTATLNISAEVKDLEQLNRLFTALRRLPDMIEMGRALGGRVK